MDDKHALNDLKAIRQIMERTRQAATGENGWLSVVGGLIWLITFLSHQLLPDPLSAWVWMPTNIVGLSVIAWLLVRIDRRGSASSPILQSVMLSWLALAVFDVLFACLFEMETSNHFPLLILMTIALGYAQTGLLFGYWPLAIVGAVIAVLVVGAFLFVQPYFYLVVAILGGGLLIGTGLWMVRSGE